MSRVSPLPLLQVAATGKKDIFGEMSSPENNCQFAVGERQREKLREDWDTERRNKPSF